MFFFSIYFFAHLLFSHIHAIHCFFIIKDLPSLALGLRSRRPFTLLSSHALHVYPIFLAFPSLLALWCQFPVCVAASSPSSCILSLFLADSRMLLAHSFWKNPLQMQHEYSKHVPIPQSSPPRKTAIAPAVDDDDDNHGSDCSVPPSSGSAPLPANVLYEDRFTMFQGREERTPKTLT